MMTIKQYATEKGISDRTARKQLERLVAMGELVREKGLHKLYVFYKPKKDDVKWHDPFNKCPKPKAEATPKPPPKPKVWKNPRRYSGEKKWPMTERQAKILRLYDSGLTTEEIAKLMDITVNTLHKHMDRIYYKLDVHSRQEAIEKAFSEDCKPKTEALET
jgi:DNA-binding CsgD family transcriptional regulator